MTLRLRCVVEPTEPVTVVDDGELLDKSPAAAETNPPRLRLVLLLCVAAALLLADVISKLIVVANMVQGDRPFDVIPSVLDLQLTRNPGAAFGFAAGATVIFTVVAAAVVVFIIRAARKLGSVGWAWALGLLLGGALGNLGDRIFRAPGPLRGHVVDWIHLHHWPVFNIADSGVVIGGLLAVLLSMRGIRLDGTRAQAESDTETTDSGQQDT
jgi:signal peptidase II